MPFDAIVCDEATRISSHKSLTSKAVRKLKAKHRFALTGTPVANKPMDIWGLIDFVSPGALGTYWSFINRYVYTNQYHVIISYRNMDELAQRIKPYYIRRLKKDVLLELPPILESDVPFNLAKQEIKLYNEIRSETFFKVENGALAKKEIINMDQGLPKLMALRQLCDSMELLGNINTSSKMSALKELIPQLSMRKTIIFTEFKEMANIIHREIGGQLITGDIKNEDRQPILDKFKDDDVPVLVMTSAGEYGLNIQAASCVIHFDQPWSVKGKIQREGRAHRRGQTAESVLVYNLLAQGSVDYHIKKLLEKKLKISDDVLDEGDVISSQAEIQEALALEPIFVE